MLNKNGATIWARQTIESDIFFWKPDKWFKIWFFIISKANHSDTKQFKRGECFLTGKRIQDATGATPDQVKKCLSWLRQEQMIETKRSTRGFTVSINKYNQYQDFKYYISTDESTREAPEKHQRSTTINKNEKNVRMKEDNTSVALKAPTPAQEVRKFFENEEEQQKLIGALSARGVPRDVAETEIRKFVAYWTEPNGTGTKQLWQTKPTFELQRRLTTWLGKVNGYQKPKKGTSKTINL